MARCQRWLVAVPAVLSCLVTIARAEEPFAFEIRNGRQAGGLVFRSVASASPWQRTVHVVVAGDAARDSAGLTIPRPILVETDDGRIAEIAATLPAPRQLAPGDAAPVSLSGSFPGPGVYQGELILLSLGRQRVVPLRVTIDPPAAPVVLVEHGARAVALTGDVPAEVEIRVGNPGPAAVSVPAPRIATVSRMDGPRGEPLQISFAPTSGAGPVVTLGPGEIVALRLAVPGIVEPGIYQVDAIVAPAGQPTMAVVRTVYRRWSPWWAALAIAAGAALAWGIRWYTEGGRDRLQLRRRMAFLVEQISSTRTEGRDDGHVAAARVLELDVLDRVRELRWRGDAVALTALVARAEARLALLRDVITASRDLARLEVASQVVPRAVLDAALAAVRVDPGADAAIQEQRERVSRLALDELWRSQLTDNLRQIEAQLVVQKSVASSGVRAVLIEQVEPHLASSHAALRDGDLDSVARALSRGQLALLDVVINAAAEQCTGVPPPGVDAESWKGVCSAVRGYLDDARAKAQPEARYASVLRAQETYFRSAIEGLMRAIRARAGSASGGEEEQLHAMEVELRVVLERDVIEAAALYADRRRRFELLASDVARGQVSRSASAQPLAGWIPVVLSSIARRGTGSPSVVTWNRTLASVGAGVSLAVFGLAVLAGLRALWLDDASWGGAGDTLVAFLWGAGVQATGDAIAGVIGVRERMGAVPP